MTTRSDQRKSLAVFTGSATPRVSRCISSGLFGVVASSSAAASSGSAGHVHMAHRAMHGVDEAMRMLPAVIAKYGLDERAGRILTARLRKFDYVPPPNSVAEVALAICRSDDPDARVVRVQGGRGHYPDLPENAVCPTQIDLLYSEPEPLDFTDPKRPRCPPGSTLFVIDLKFGDDAHVDPVEHNAQIATAAVAAAFWTGAEQVVPALVYPGPGDGEWDVPTDGEGNLISWSRERLEVEYAELVVLYEARMREIARIAAGHPPTIAEGPWCDWWCPSINACPAKLALVRSVIDPLAEQVLMPRELTTEQAGKLVAAMVASERFSRKARKALETYVRSTGKPIRVGEGFVWGPVIEERDEIDPARAASVLVSELGTHAYEAVRVSKDGLEEAMKMKHLEEGLVRKRAGAMRVLFAKLAEANAMRKVPREEYRVHRDNEPSALPAEGEATSLEAALEAAVEKVEDSYG